MSEGPEDTVQGQVRLLDLRIDLDRQTVARGSTRIDLPDLSFRLLAALVAHSPESVSKDDLIREVWGDVVVGDETLAQRVRLLRQALGDDSQDPRYFLSVRGRGYRLAADVRRSTGQAGRSRLWLVGAGLLFVAAAVAATWYSGERAPPPATAANSIAVLPFTDLSPQQSYGYFADGMQEELLTRLTDVDGLQIASRTSVEPYRSTELSVPEIANEIGVAAIIEGSVRLDAERVRVTVQLIDAATDRHLWADNFDRTLSVQSIFSIQEEVAEQIAQALRLEYGNDEHPVRLPTDSLDAYSAYLLGRHHTFRQTPDDLTKAIVHLERATTLDSEFAEAYASLGWAYSFLGTNYGGVPPREAYPKAKEAALKALSLDSELADARTLYADILTWYDWEFEAAEREYLKTLQLDPLNVLGYALFLTTQERNTEALKLIERRIQAHPDDPYVRVNAAWRYFSADQYERAIAEATLAGDHPDAPAVLGFSWLASEESARAIRVFEADLEKRGRQAPQLSNLAVALFANGRNVEGQALLEELEALSLERFFSPALLAAVYFAAGDADSAFDSLSLALDARVREIIFLRVTRMLNGYRDDPRYAALVRSAGL